MKIPRVWVPTNVHIRVFVVAPNYIYYYTDYVRVTTMVYTTSTRAVRAPRTAVDARIKRNRITADVRRDITSGQSRQRLAAKTKRLSIYVLHNSYAAPSRSSGPTRHAYPSGVVGN